MLIVNLQYDDGHRSMGRTGMIVLAGFMATGLIGCASHPVEHNYSNSCRTQLQFYSPPGAQVTVKACSVRTHEVAGETTFDNRLERTPEEFSVFNLMPGRYEFKYVSAEGLPGVNIYGELEIMHANSREAAMFQRRSFVPISLPSEYYQKVEIRGNEIFPYRGEAFRTAIDEHDIQRLKLGDVVEKVFLVADLENAARQKDEISEQLKILDRKLEYVDARFRNAYFDFRIDVNDPSANFWGTDKKFIHWEHERQELLQKKEKLENCQRRLTALLKGDHVLIRKGMLAVATEEVVAPHKDVVKAAEEIGEVLVVMRVGGRHGQWGNPRQEAAAYER